MESRDILSAILERSGQTKNELARTAGISGNAVGKSFRAEAPSLDVVARYLEMMGFTLYAVPSSLHVEAISDEAIKVEANKPAK